MTHEPLEIAKIALAVVGSATALGLVAGFYEGRAVGQKAFWMTLPLAGLFGTLQVVDSSHAPWVALAAALLALLVIGWRRYRR